MISQTAEYALRAIVFLANRPGQAHTTDSIAQGTKVPVGYLAKIMQGLTRHRLVQSQRGLHGGFTLLADPNALSIFDVVQAVDPLLRITACPLHLEGHDRLCPLHRTLDAAVAQVEQIYRSTSITSLLGEPGDTQPLCGLSRR